MSGKAWVFQTNPNHFNIQKALIKMDKIAWPIKRYKNEIDIGDFVIIWITGKYAGIYAIGTVVSKPAPIKINADQKKFMILEDKFHSDVPMAYVKIDKIFPNPILKIDLLKDPILSNMSVIRMVMGTVFRVTPQENIELQKYLFPRKEKR